MTVATTASGQPITCDGCGAYIERVDAATMVVPLPPDLAVRNYGHTGVSYIVCAPLPDDSRPCLSLAELDEEMSDRTRCRVPDCDGTRCDLPEEEHVTAPTDLTRYYLRSTAEDGLADFAVLTGPNDRYVGNAENGTTLADLYAMARHAHPDLDPTTAQPPFRLVGHDSVLMWMPPAGEHVTLGPVPEGTTLAEVSALAHRHETTPERPDDAEERP